MASVGKLVLLNETGLAASQTDPAKSTELMWVDLIGVCELYNSVGGNFTLTVEHSPNGVDWVTLIAVPAQVGDGFSSAEVTAFAFPNVRANLVRNAGTADVICSLYYDKRK